MARRDRPATMEDVASLAGVSRALVSIVYRDAPGASDVTRAKVLAAGTELGYRPDHRARLLGRARTRLLGVTFDVRQPFHGDLVESLYTAAESAGYELALSAVAPTRDEPRAIHSLLDYRCEALILLGPMLAPSALAALATDQPVIVVARKVRAAGVDVVRTDDTAGARLATEHLIGLGHTRIAHIDGGRSPGASDRRASYRATMRRAGLTPVIIPAGRTEDEGALAAKQLLDTHPSITAVFTYNDLCAVGFLDTVRQSRQVPTDLSVIGYDNTTIAALSHINLTTIAQNTPALAEAAIHQSHLRTTIPSTTPPPPIAPRLIFRTTTGPA